MAVRPGKHIPANPPVIAQTEPQHRFVMLTPHLERGAATGGAFAEFGVGTGGFVANVALSKLFRDVWVFDTFCGYPEQTLWPDDFVDVARFYGEAATDAVRQELESMGIRCVEGLLPDSLHGCGLRNVGFAHVDLDSYGPTLDVLEYLDFVVLSGGVVCVHDYESQYFKGVTRAVDQFMADDGHRLRRHDGGGGYITLVAVDD